MCLKGGFCSFREVAILNYQTLLFWINVGRKLASFSFSGFGSWRRCFFSFFLCFGFDHLWWGGVFVRLQVRKVGFEALGGAIFSGHHLASAMCLPVLGVK